MTSALPTRPLGIIGGSGLSSLSTLELTERRVVRTPWGEPSGALALGRLAGCPVVFLPRHGFGHTIAPHEVNYRANIWALREVGVQQVISVASVGGIRADCVPGSLVLPDQIIDYTWGRGSTFFEGVDNPVTHVDFTEPYSMSLRAQVRAAAHRCGEPIIEQATYGATQGPRLETAAEITRMERDGCDLVGMTGMPETVLARELTLDYATLAVVANPAAGRGSSATVIRRDAIEQVLAQAMQRAHRIISALAAEFSRSAA